MKPYVPLPRDKMLPAVVAELLGPGWRVDQHFKPEGLMLGHIEKFVVGYTLSVFVTVEAAQAVRKLTNVQAAEAICLEVCRLLDRQLPRWALERLPLVP